MALQPGTQLGTYEITAQIGAGGMGEVYRARDLKLNRDVAVKVLSAQLTDSATALARFEREARAVAALSHPNILSIFDFGQQAGVAYTIVELLEGQTLRERLARDGTIPQREAIDIAVQIARGLSAAHGQNIAHRDLKPENVFVTLDGRVKILDFGLARQMSAFIGADATISPTLGPATDPGTVLGTVGYMSPEQVRGEPGDQRSDIFSFGCVLYELVSGRRAFQSATAAETMTLILRQDPPDLASASSSLVSPGLSRIVQHCLEKNPGERFQSASDVAFALGALSGATSGAAATQVAGPVSRPFRAKRLAIAALVVLAAAAGFVGRGLVAPAAPPPRFLKLTFQRGTIYSARFTPDGESVVYGAAWGGQPLGLYSARFDAPESRPFGIVADALAVSRSGEMALSLGRHTLTNLLSVGRLARAPLAGGIAPREVLDDVEDADWSPDGQSLAISREVDSEARLEFPIGRMLYKNAGYVSAPRVSPSGDGVAFINHPLAGDDRGTIAFVDTAGRVQVLTPEFPSVTGLAWSPDGSEIWFSAWVGDQGYSIDAVRRDGHRRTVHRIGTRARLFDVTHDRALVGFESTRAEVAGMLASDTRERDLSWLDGTVATALSPAGDAMLFVEGFEGGGPQYSFFLRRADSATPVRLGEGTATGLSADGRWVLGHPPSRPARIIVAPTGPGETRTISLPSLEAIMSASWLPDGRRALLMANEPGQPVRAWLLDIGAGTLKAASQGGLSVGIFGSGQAPVSPDGRSYVAKTAMGDTVIVTMDGGSPRPVQGLSKSERVIGWSEDGRGLFVASTGTLPMVVSHLDIASGRREGWKVLTPADPVGVTDIMSITMTPDGHHYAYSYMRSLTDLSLIEGLR